MSSNYKLSKASSSRSTSSSSSTVHNNDTNNTSQQHSNGVVLNGLTNFEATSSIRSSICYKGGFPEDSVPTSTKNGKSNNSTASPTPYSPNLASKDLLNIRSKTKDGGSDRDGSPLLTRGLLRGSTKVSSSAQDNRNGQQQQQQANYDNLLGGICPPSSSMHSLNSSLERGGPGRMSLQSPHPYHAHHQQQHQHVSPQHNLYPCAATYGQIQTGRSKVFDIDGKITWVEIVEPKSKTKMFANLSTGECRWDEPRNVPILRANNPNLTQWWELFDPKTNRYYYYSPKDQRTIWQKPTSLDAIVVPLAKLQILKQNTTQSATVANDSSFDGTAGSISSGHVTPSSPLSSPSHSSEMVQGRVKYAAGSRLVRLNDAQTQTPIDQQLTRPTMVSRWTQTTNMTPLNVKPLPTVTAGSIGALRAAPAAANNNNRLGHIMAPPGPGRVAQPQRPSLHHYLLSEARFAKGINGHQAGAGGAGHSQQQRAQHDQLYDQVDDVAQPRLEDYYDMVTDGASNYYDVYEPAQHEDNYFDGYEDDEEVDYYDEEDETDEEDCDADDEFGEEVDDDEEDEEDEDFEDDDDDELVADEEEEEDMLADRHQQEMLMAEANYENAADFIRSGPIRNSKVANVVAARQQQHQILDPKMNDSNSGPDGLRMSASFTAVDFKRNAVGRSSYTPSMHTQHQPHPPQYPQQPYSNPFNSGSLRSSTSRLSGATTSTTAATAGGGGGGISMITPTGSTSVQSRQRTASNIADRIQLFNQKSTSAAGSATAAAVGQQSPSPVALRNSTGQQSNVVGRLSSSPATQVDGLRLSTSSSSNARHSTVASNNNEHQHSNVQRYQRESTQSSQQQQQGPSKSASLTGIAQQQQQQQPKDLTTKVANLSLSPGGVVAGSSGSQPSQSPSPSSLYSDAAAGHRRLNSKFSAPGSASPQPPPESIYLNAVGNRNSISLGGKFVAPTTSTPVINANAQPAANFPVNFNDAHMIMLNKSNSHKIITTRGKGNNSGDVLIPVGKATGTNKDKTTAEKKKKKKTGTNNNKENGTNGAGGKKKTKGEKSGGGRTNAPVVTAGVTGTTGAGAAGNSIESFARECVSRHRKGGIFSKKKTLKSMLVHTTKPLKKPMISTIADSLLVKEAVACFKLIQVFMGDRPVSPTTIAGESIAQPTAMSSPQLPPPPPQLSDEQLLFKLINVCVQFAPLRDEVFVQVARQVTANPHPASEQRGLELMATLFWYFTASPKLAAHLHSFLVGHRSSITAMVRRKFEQQLHRSKHTHSHLFFRKPAGPAEVARVYRCVRAQHVGVFGEHLADALVVGADEQANSNLLGAMEAGAAEMHRDIPWPIIMLTEALLEPRHEDREGVFRCVGDLDEVHKLKMKIDTTLMEDADFITKIGAARRSQAGDNRKLTDGHDIHVIACTLKLYFRELRESPIPAEMYLEALEAAHSPASACALLERLPRVNRRVLRYLIKFLQIFSTPEHVQATKMDDANLSMVWAPNILRNMTMVTNNAHIYEHTRAEMSLVRTLIQHLDT